MSTGTIDVAPVEAGVVEPEKKTELVLAKGIASDMWADAASTFIPILRQDMPLAERKDAIRQVMVQSMTIDDKLNLISGELLYEVNKNGYWKEWTFVDKAGGKDETRPYATFEEYCDLELNMKKRKALYLVSIYEKFVVELDLPKEILRDLEWSKAKELVGIITAENAADLMDKIGTMTLKQVIDMAKAMKTSAATSGTSGATAEPVDIRRLTFKLTPEQEENVNGALKLAESMTGSDKPGNQLDLICSEFTAGAVGMGLEGATAKLDLIIANVQRAFGVTLSVSGMDEARYAAIDKSDKAAAAAAVAAVPTVSPAA